MSETTDQTTATKAWYTSKTVWGAVLAIAAPLLGQITHHSISDVDTQNLADVLSTIGAAVGSLLAIYGRVMASSTLAGGQNK